MMPRRSGRLAIIGAFLTGGCGLLIGLEDRELPAVTSPEGGAESDGGSDDAPASDAPATDAPAADGGGDACACAAGCTESGLCKTEIVSIGVGADHNCIVRADGAMFCMGHNDLGQLATAGADRTAYVKVALVVAGTPVSWKEVSAARDSTCALATTGDLYCWGSNSVSQLAQDSDGGASFVTPKKVNLGIAKVKSFSVGSAHACAILDVATGSNVRCWGYGANGELGLGADAGAPTEPVFTPATVFGLRAKTIHANDTDDALEGGRTCAVSEGGVPFCWGLNAGSEITTAALPTTCGTDAGAVPCAVSATAFDVATTVYVGSGVDYACELVGGATKKIRCRSAVNVLLPSDCNASSEIFDVVTPAGVVPDKLSTGTAHACFIDTKGEVYCFGDNELLQTGVVGSDKCGPHPTQGSARRAAVPIRVLGPSSTLLNAKIVATGRASTIVYTTAGTLLGWGRSSFGGLGPVDGGVIDAGDAGRTCEGVNCITPRVIVQPAP